MIPESRKDDGLMLGRPIRENVSLASLPRLGRFGFVQRRVERSRVGDALVEATALRVLETTPAALSGGNQQKLLFARALLARPAVLIADEPTRGVDVGAKRDLYELLVAMAARGVAVLLISNEVEEILGLAHRVLVMRAGRVVAELDGEAVTEEAILAASFGRAMAEAS
jgi:simple sugar transport system ATP-binding protein/ribose transport system ATP-binding protein